MRFYALSMSRLAQKPIFVNFLQLAPTLMFTQMMTAKIVDAICPFLKNRKVLGNLITQLFRPVRNHKIPQTKILRFG